MPCLDMAETLLLASQAMDTILWLALLLMSSLFHIELDQIPDVLT